MSLLSEVTAQVIASQTVAPTQQLVLPTTLSPPVSTGFYKQQVGIAVPRGNNVYAAILDVQTNEPLRFPANFILMRTCWSAIVPLVSANVNTSTVQLVLLRNLDDLVNNNLNDYVVSGISMTLDDVNGKASTENSDLFASGQNAYVYPAITCSLELPPLNPLPPITDGTVKLIFQYI